MSAASVKDFLFCSVCRRSHNLGQKHLYSKKHTKNLQHILHKYGGKIEEARRSMESPCVIDGELEPGAQFWCHFCHTQVPKHMTDGNTSVQYGGVFEHLASAEHRKHTDSWWTDNGADKSEKNKFVVFQSDLHRFKNNVQKKLEELERKTEREYDKSVQIIREREEIQKRIAQQPPVPYVPPPVTYRTVRNHLGILQNPTGCHDGQRVWGGGIVKYRKDSDQWFPWEFDLEDGRKNVGKKNSGSFNSTTGSLPRQKDRNQLQMHRGRHNVATLLPRCDVICTSISELTTAKWNIMDNNDDDNVHTGATPPWLIPDDEPGSSSTIGPSLTEFQKHLERTKKHGKNPNRVGANFDRKTEVSSAWLPSFGGVWNAGPRWQTRRSFKMKEPKSNT